MELLTFFKHARLASSFASLAMGLDPTIPPIVLGAPGARVQVEGTEIERLDLEVGGEVEPLAKLVWITTVTCNAKPFITQCDHVAGVETLDVLRDCSRPGGNDASLATVASRLVG